MATYATISVDFTGTPGTDTSYALERATAAAGPYTTIAVAVPLLAEQDVFTDTTAPFGVPLYYRATGDQTAAVTTYTAGPLDQAGQVWLRDPLRPWADLALDFCDVPQSGHVAGCVQPDPEFVWVGLGEEVWRADAGLFDVLNSETPADVWARRKHADTSISFFTRTLAAADRVYELFTAGGPLLLQLPPEYGWADAFVQPGDATMSRISRDQRRPERRWTVPVTIVDRPLGPAQGTACANWCALADAFPTYGDLPAGLTFADLAAGEVVCPGGEPVQLITDTFARTVVDGWGVTDTGQTWTTTGGAAANYDVTGGVGTMAFGAMGVTMNAVVPVPAPDVNIRMDFSLPAVPTGAAITVGVTARENTTSNLYMARASIATTGVITVSLRKRVAGTETQLSTITLGTVLAPGAWYTVRLIVSGSNLAGTVWPAGSVEPAWQTTATDPDLAAAGDAGLRVSIGSATNPLPMIISFDNLVVT